MAPRSLPLTCVLQVLEFLKGTNAAQDRMDATVGAETAAVSKKRKLATVQLSQSVKQVQAAFAADLEAAQDRFGFDRK